MEHIKNVSRTRQVFFFLFFFYSRSRFNVIKIDWELYIVPTYLYRYARVWRKPVNSIWLPWNFYDWLVGIHYLTMACIIRCFQYIIVIFYEREGRQKKKVHLYCDFCLSTIPKHHNFLLFTIKKKTISLHVFTANVIMDPNMHA